MLVPELAVGSKLAAAAPKGLQLATRIAASRYSQEVVLGAMAEAPAVFDTKDFRNEMGDPITDLQLAVEVLGGAIVGPLVP